MIRREFEAYSRKYDMLPPGTRVLCACSGGADSTALLRLLCDTPGLRVACAHFNHRLRGEESDRDEAFVRGMCDELGITFYCGGGDVRAYAGAHRLGIEEAAREMRYAFLEETAAQHCFDRIATAHHAEDNAETILLNLIRGSGLRGLCGIPPVRGRLIRPLLGVTRSEILAYLDSIGQGFVDDSTNRADDCARNRMRHRVLPLLAEENPAALEHIRAAAELLRQDEEYLSDCAERFIEAHCEGGALPVRAFLDLPEAVGARVLRQTLGPLSRAHVEAVRALCRSGETHAALDLPGRRVRKERDRLILSCGEDAPLARRELTFGETLLPEAGFRILRRKAAPGEEIHNSFNTFCFSCALIRGKMFVASRGPGDSVRLLGRGCTKTLKKLFQEAGLPLSERERTPVIYDEAGVAAVYGFGAAERCAAASASDGGIEIIEIYKM